MRAVQPIIPQPRTPLHEDGTSTGLISVVPVRSQTKPIIPPVPLQIVTKRGKGLHIEENTPSLIAVQASPKLKYQ